MKTKWLTAAVILSCVWVFTFPSRAQTILSGNISGVWSPSRNPYIISDNATVPSGQTLTIQPGVVVWIGAGLSITVEGNIQAIGTATQRITIQAPISSQYWNNIYLYNYGNASVANFEYCDFLNATDAIYMSDGNYTGSEILNCTFSNCVSSAISYSYLIIPPVIQNCLFSGTGNGCVIINSGGPAVIISANIFNNLTGTAVFLQGYAAATIINNAIVNCAAGVNAGATGSAQIQSCIFNGCTSAVEVSGSNSRTVSYNDFFDNTTNFVGYPSTYDTPIILNRNGTSCDLLYNIFQDPQFISATDFQLQVTSPCIDAGEGSPSNFDCCFPPSIGTVTNDIGAYGGPNAGQWIMPVSTNDFTLSASSYIGVTINPPSAGHYELEYASALAGTNTWIQLTNMDLSAPFIWTEPVSSPERFYRAVKLY